MGGREQEAQDLGAATLGFAGLKHAFQALSWKVEWYWWVLNSVCAERWNLVTPESHSQKGNHILAPRA